MTKEFDARNAEKSRAVFEAMAERADTGKRVLTERERQILDMWPRFEDGEYVWFGDIVKLPTYGAISAEAIEFTAGKVHVKDAEDGDWNTSMRATRPLKRPVQSVLDADGVEIRVGDTVWTLDGLEGVVTKVEEGAAYIAYESDYAQCEEAANLTHVQPDSWERLEEDALNFARDNQLPHSVDQMERDVLDIVRRAKALAGIEMDE